MPSTCHEVTWKSPGKLVSFEMLLLPEIEYRPANQPAAPPVTNGQLLSTGLLMVCHVSIISVEYRAVPPAVHMNTPSWNAGEQLATSAPLARGMPVNTGCSCAVARANR